MEDRKRKVNQISNTLKECYVCHTTQNLHRHHIYFGANRKISEKYGFVVYLCGRHHNLSNAGVHFNKALDLELKRKCEQDYIDNGHTIEEFIKLIGKNYL